VTIRFGVRPCFFSNLTSIAWQPSYGDGFGRFRREHIRRDIDGSPKPVFSSANRYDQFIKMPAVLS
jgi:hypothetical protein